MIKAIFFDIHGVITHGDFQEAYENFANRVDIPNEPVAEYHAKYISGLLDGSVSSDHMLLALGLDKKMNVETMLKEWEAAIVEITTVDQRMLDLLKKLRENYVLAALTNLTEQRYFADINLNLYKHFDFKVLSYKEGVKKPDPIFFQRALAVTDVLPSEAIFTDDQLKNTDIAGSLGISAIQFLDYDQFVTDLTKLGVAV